MKIVAYIRVSTQKQGQSGLGIEAQIAAINAYADQNGADIVATYEEVESGRKVKERPQMLAAIAHAKKVKGKLVVAKLDRLARNVAFVSGIMDSGVDFVACDNPYATRLTLHILAAVAEHEAAMIAVRTKSALAAAKARGIRLGSKPGADLSAAHKGRVDAADARAANIIPIIASIEHAGVTTLQGIANALEARGVKTPKGNSNWHPSTVSRIKRRAA
jgi:DNA invertase Pin-like site-specific DNA recombinase